LRNQDMGIATTVLLLLTVPAAWSGPAATNLLARGVRQFRAGAGNWDYPTLTNAVSLFQRACRAEPDSYAAHYWQGAAQFHALLHRLGWEDAVRDRNEEARIMEHAVGVLERALALRKDDPETHALLSTLHGMRIAHAPHTALWRGRKVLYHRKLALRADPDNPRTHYLLGMSHFHAPAILGGKKEALAFLRKAERLFEAEQAESASPLTPVWGYAHCLAFIGEAYRDRGNREEAEAYYRKALAVNPEHRMAKEGLQECLRSKVDK